jgi:hypothetical protein
LLFCLFSAALAFLACFAAFLAAANAFAACTLNK